MTLIRTKLTVEQWRKKERVDELAHKVAFDSAVSILQSHGTPITDKRGHLLWYDLDPAAFGASPWIAEAMKYLDLRGLLRRHRTVPNRVNVRWA